MPRHDRLPAGLIGTGLVLLLAAAPAAGQVQEQELFTGSATAHNLGADVDVSPDGTWLVAGLVDPSLNTGEAWVYQHDGVAYQLHDVLSAPRAVHEQGQQVAVSADGTVVAIGCPKQTPDLGAGAVQIYHRVGATWTAEPVILGNYRFGVGVDLSDDGTVLVVGEGLGIHFAVYRYDGISWIEDTVTFEPGTAGALGTTVAIDGGGQRLIAGAPQHTPTAGVFQSGAVRIFAYDGVAEEWTEEALIENPDPIPGELFGNDGVAIDGVTAVVGVRNDDEVSLSSGAAYVYEAAGTTWSFTQKLVPNSDVCAYLCRFGSDVAVLGDRVLVRSQGQAHPEGGDGASAALYRRGDIGGGEDPWVFVSRIFRESIHETASGSPGSVALSGGRAVIGAPGDYGEIVPNSFAGAVRTYQLNGCLCGDFAESFDDALGAPWIAFGCGTASAGAGELTLAVDAGCRIAGIQSDREQLMLCGDFEVTVDWSFGAWPAVPLGRTRELHLAVNRANGAGDLNTLAAIGRIDRYEAGSCFTTAGQHFAWFDPMTLLAGGDPANTPNPCATSLASTSAPTTATSGSFRIKREGSTITTSYDEGGGWVDLISPVGVDDTAVYLQLWTSCNPTSGPVEGSPNPDAFDVRFSNLVVTDLSGAVCAGPAIPPRLALAVQGGDPGTLMPGDPITIELSMLDLASSGSEAAAFQAFLAFDDAHLSFASGTYTAAPFGLPILAPIAAIGNEIDLAAGIDILGGQLPSSADAVLATLTFAVTGPIEACNVASAVSFRASALPSRLIDAGGMEIAGVLLENLDPLVVDGLEPVLTVPADIAVNADAGVCTASIDPGLATAIDGCDLAPVVSFLRSDGKPGLTDPYDSADSPITITWTATDGSGNAATGDQVVTVYPFNDLVLDVELSGAYASPIDRCITFELFRADCTSIVFDQTLTFTGGLASAVLDVPCGDYTCVTAVDALHGLRRVDDDGDFAIVGAQYVCDFTASGTTNDAIVGGNLNGDEFVDILDFGVFVVEYGVDYGSGDTDCLTAAPHADVNGDGLVAAADFTFIQVNFLAFAESPCCVMMTAQERRHGRIGVNALGTGGPVRSISVAQLRTNGLGSLVPADLNRDGYLDVLDIAFFLDGSEP